MGNAGNVYNKRILDVELDRLLAQLPAIAIEGAKAVGKTATAVERSRTRFLLDDPTDVSRVEADPRRVVEAPAPVLIDEWQFVPELWDRVRRAVDAGAPPASFLLTGSSSPREAGSHSGAGRIVSLRMRPLSLYERLSPGSSVGLGQLLDGGRPHLDAEADIRLEDYVAEIARSGFPGLRRFSGAALDAQLDGYITRVVDRDLPELGREVRNPAALRRWMSAYAAAIATSTSFEKIRDAASSARSHPPAFTTTLPYRDALERLFILDPVPGWQPAGSQLARVGLAPKHHLVDPALACRLLGLSVDGLLAGHGPRIGPSTGVAFLGALFESLVTQSVRVYAQACGATVAHLRVHGGEHEIDLIIERRDGAVVAIEVKLATEPSGEAIRHLNWLRERLGDQLLDAVVVTTGRNAYRRQDGIAVVPAALLGP